MTVQRCLGSRKVARVPGTRRVQRCGCGSCVFSPKPCSASVVVAGLVNNNGPGYYGGITPTGTYGFSPLTEYLTESPLFFVYFDPISSSEIRAGLTIRTIGSGSDCRLQVFFVLMVDTLTAFDGIIEIPWEGTFDTYEIVLDNRDVELGWTGGTATVTFDYTGEPCNCCEAGFAWEKVSDSCAGEAGVDPMTWTGTGYASGVASLTRVTGGWLWTNGTLTSELIPEFEGCPQAGTYATDDASECAFSVRITCGGVGEV